MRCRSGCLFVRVLLGNRGELRCDFSISLITEIGLMNLLPTVSSYLAIIASIAAALAEAQAQGNA